MCYLLPSTANKVDFPLPLSPMRPYLRPQFNSNMASCNISLPWKVMEKLAILTSLDFGWTAKEPVQARASAFKRASASNLAHSASVKYHHLI